MTNRQFILIDATLESQAPFFAQNSIFQSWLRSYSDISEALQFLSQTNLPYRITVYIARDNIFDNVTLFNRNATLLQIIGDLQTVQHVTVFCSTINTDLEQSIRSIPTDPRLIRKVISVINLHADICATGISYFDEQISRCIARKEMHVIPYFKRNQNELMEYWEKVIADQKSILDALVDEYSNRSGEPTS